MGDIKKGAGVPGLPEQGGHLWRELRQLLVDPYCSLRDKGNPPPFGALPDRYAPVRRRPGVASHLSKGGRIAIVLSYCYLTALAYPFKWSKTRGGYRVEWLGMETEYSSFRLGLTEKRASWLVA